MVVEVFARTTRRRSRRRSSRSTRASIRRRATRWCARRSRTSRALPTPGASVRVRVPVGAAAHGGRDPGERAAQGPDRRPRLRDRARTTTARSAPTCARSQSGADARRRGRRSTRGSPSASRSPPRVRSSCAKASWSRSSPTAQAADLRRRSRRLTRSDPHASFTDIFIKHPVLAIVVNLVLVLVGWRAISTLPVQQYPKIESSSVLITTVYTGASAETVRGFLTTPIERVVSRRSAASTTSSRPAAPASASITVRLKLNHSSTVGAGRDHRAPAAGPLGTARRRPSRRSSKCSAPTGPTRRST